MTLARTLAALAFALLAAACSNRTQPAEQFAGNTLFSAFIERSPRHLDPTASYPQSEAPYTYSIYEPLYKYHYLKRPYEIVPGAAEAVAEPVYVDKDGKMLSKDAPAEQIAESWYDIRIKPGILFAPHPAFARDERGSYRYHHLTREQVGQKRSPWEFEYKGVRELTADDYVYAFRRHATTRIVAPLFGLFSDYVVGLKEYGELIKTRDAELRKGLGPTNPDKPFLDFRQWPMPGVVALDRHTLRIRLNGRYPQWNYWLAMSFTAPVPWEADAFYAQPGMTDNGLTLDTWPVGTGPYMMTEYIQDRRHVMKRNPNWRGEPYPCEGSEEDRAQGLLDDCGRPTPFIDTLVFNIEKERVSLKTKFRQGFLDAPVVEEVKYGAEYSVDMQNSEAERLEFAARGFRFPRTSDPRSWFLGFNMIDPVVGYGDTPERQRRNRMLRQALSIAIDWEEFMRIFPGHYAGEVAMNPVPPGVFGARSGAAGMNPVTHRLVNGRVERRPIEDAKRLMTAADYPEGRDTKTGKQLVLNYDYRADPTPDVKAEINWMVRQFAKLGVQLEVRATTYNQYQDKVRKGAHQVFWNGWMADYPDAETFMALLYGPNGKTTAGGENESNYANPAFDRLYRRMATHDDGPGKQALLDEMSKILQEDTPWAFGVFPDSSGAFQPWLHNGKPTILARDMLRYYRVDVPQRVRLQAEWNHPMYALLSLPILAVLALALVLYRSHRRAENTTARRFKERAPC